MLKAEVFNSINEFYNSIKDKRENQVFKGKECSSDRYGDYYFYGTQSWNEAVDLLNNGWKTEAEVLTQEFKKMEIAKQEKTKQYFDVVGFQASVPRYLQGIPTNMVNSRRIKVPNKVINLVKDISYSGHTRKERIEKESLKVLSLVKSLESKGYAINLWIILGTGCESQQAVVKIKVKNANERLNISKMAFPLVHPSMLRRFLFKYIETAEHITEPEFYMGYGRPLDDSQLKAHLKPGEKFIPKFIGDNFEGENF